MDNNPDCEKMGGLTAFGRKVVQEMNRLGMMVDLSHTAHQTQLDAISESKAPVLFSHSCAYAICQVSRNVRDDVLLKLVKKNCNLSPREKVEKFTSLCF